VSPPIDDSPRARFVAGMRVMTPPLAGVLPFGLVTGVASTAAGLTLLETMAMSVATFSGIVHIVAVQLYAAGAPIVVILLTAAVLSLRLVMYSAGLSPWLAHLPLRWKLAVSYCLTDHAYALSVVDFTHHPQRANKHWFILGGGVLSFVAWHVAVAAGVLLGAQVPPRWSLDFSFALTFLALLVAVVHDRPTLVAALVGGGASLVTYLLPLRLGPVTAALAGIAAAIVWNTLEARWSGR
jgi:predicted branched-subunit amino acid permease